MSLDPSEPTREKLPGNYIVARHFSPFVIRRVATLRTFIPVKAAINRRTFLTAGIFSPETNPASSGREARFRRRGKTSESRAAWIPRREFLRSSFASEAR